MSFPFQLTKSDISFYAKIEKQTKDMNNSILFLKNNRMDHWLKFL